MTKYVLASSSPRRKELLKKIVNNFEIIVPDIDELKKANEKALDYVERIAITKASKINEKDKIVISADTIVVYNEKIIGKPKDFNEALNILKMLSNKSHFVYTAVCIRYNDKYKSFVDKTKVYFKDLSLEEIITYINEKNPYDKAGSYGIQDSDFVLKIEGSFYNVMGLPVEKLKECLKSIDNS